MVNNEYLKEFLGALGSIYKVQEKKTKYDYALKKLTIEKNNATAKRHCLREIETLVMILF